MANKTRGRFPVEIDGKTWVLQFTANAIAELEDATAKPIGDFLADLPKGGVRAMRTLMWAGLLHHQPGLTQAQTGDLIDAMGGFQAAMAVVTEAVQAAFPDPAGGAGNAGGTAA